MRVGRRLIAGMFAASLLVPVPDVAFSGCDRGKLSYFGRTMAS